MNILETLSPSPTLPTPSVVTIGTFDGIHLGHQQVLDHAVHVATEKQYVPIVVTFQNHPRQVLAQAKHVENLISRIQKLRLIRAKGFSTAYYLPFTREFSQQTAEEFLRHLKEVTAFKHLVLGHDAAFGRDKGGTRENVRALANQLDFTVAYVPALEIDGVPVSSTRVRALIRAGKLQEASLLLGRPYSIYQSVQAGERAGGRLGFPTANIELKDMCLPPLGVYVVGVRYDEREYPAVANIGHAPSVKATEAPLLEAHLLDATVDLYGKEVEVVLYDYLRPEQVFASHEALSAQIAKDVKTATAWWAKQGKP